MKEIELKTQSFDRLKSTVVKHVIPTIGFYYLDKLDAKTIQSELIKPKMKTLSFSSLKKIYDAVNSSLRYARDSGLIALNPAELVTIPKASTMNQGRENVDILTQEEIQSFVEAACATHGNGKPIYRNGEIFLLMLNTGLRIGEACALRWEDYDNKNNTLRIRSTTVQTIDGSGKRVVSTQKTVKTKNSERFILLNTNAIAALPDEKTGKYIYCASNGNLLRPRCIQNTLDNILNRAGIPHRGTHVFRHTFASQLFNNGYDVRMVSELLGHSNVNTTYNTYIHLIKERKAVAMQAIENLY